MKKIAVLAVDPVNGSGLFQYLEAFYENGISYRTFAVSDNKTISTNSGIRLETDDVIANLKGHADDYEALVFSCGDAMPVFQKNAGKPFNLDLLAVIQEFAAKQKLLIGHCASALIFEIAGVSEGRKLAVHPLAKPAIQKGIATDESFTVDRNFYTAQCEHTLSRLLPVLLETLKK